MNAIIDMNAPRDLSACINADPSLIRAADEAVVFGPYENLVGVTCHPTLRRDTSQDASGSKDRHAVIMLTAGMLPSSGPFRFHRQLAWSLAEHGIRSLRFDMSGIGESLAVGEGGSSLERAAHEVSAAIDWLAENHSVERVALYGLCSGADDAIAAGLLDERVSAIFCVDGLGYRTGRFYWNRLIKNHVPKVTSCAAWRRVLRRWGGSPEQELERLRMGFDIREFPSRDQAAKELLQLVNRQVKLHFHYTGGVSEYYNDARQFQEMFRGTALDRSGALQQIRTSYDDQCDHVAFLVEHRQRLLNLVTKRLCDMMP